jgi:hypothetical protein
MLLLLLLLLLLSNCSNLVRGKVETSFAPDEWLEGAKDAFFTGRSFVAGLHYPCSCCCWAAPIQCLLG